MTKKKTENNLWKNLDDKTPAMDIAGVGVIVETPGGTAVFVPGVKIVENDEGGFELAHINAIR